MSNIRTNRHTLEPPFNLLATCLVYLNRDKFYTQDTGVISPVESWFMKSKTNIPFLSPIMYGFMAIALLAGAVLAGAQTRFVGTITAISGNTLTVKTDVDGAHQVNVPATAVLKRITPGQKDLSAAQTIPFSNLEAGDRVRVKLDPDAPAGTEEALQIIAIKQSDLALKQQKDREDWQLRGVGGHVKSVDAASGLIVLTSGAGATAKTLTVHTTKATVLKRYAPASVRFDAALPAPIDAIHPGDQLRARGTKNADGTEISAEEVISGSFRNISGVVLSLDAPGAALVVKDLATKKPVSIHITTDTQMRRLPDLVSQMLAARLKGETDNGGKLTEQKFNGNHGEGGDPQQILSRAPAIQLGDLKKGEAIMVVSTGGTSEVTAITLLAGVEPLLEAPAASQNLLSNWSMGDSSSQVAQ
jgi:hypothetical protein